MVARSESYENMMLKLEKIVATMDTNELSLEQSMKSYEEGIKLCNKLYKVLNEAEGKIKILKEQGEENFSFD